MPRVSLRSVALWTLAALCLVAGGVARAADKRSVILPRFPYPEPLPALLAAAGQAGANVMAREFPDEPRKALAGDELTFLVSLQDGKNLQQWVLSAKTADLTEKETQLPPLKRYHGYTTMGTELKFEGRRAAIEMVLIGPMKPGQGENEVFKPGIKRRRLLVNGDYLELGFQAACEAVVALRSENSKLPAGKRFDIKLAAKPFPAEVTTQTRALAETVGFTLERERGFFGSVPAVLEYFNVIMKTPGLQDILKEVIDVSWWSIMTSKGKTKIRLEYVSQHTMKIQDLRPGLPQYVFPLVVLVNEQPAMAVSLIVTEPRAPFATAAGVVGLQAGPPYDDKPQLTVRIIGSRYSGGTRGSPAPGGE